VLVVGWIGERVGGWVGARVGGRMGGARAGGRVGWAGSGWFLSSGVRLVFLSGAMSIDDCKLPDDITARPVAPDERRIFVRGMPFLCKVVRGVVVSWVREMPEDISSLVLPLLVLTMDQGGIGCAGVYFAMNFLKLMVATRWDKYHRGTNDVKLDVHAHFGWPLPSELCIDYYVYNLNYGPFGKGGFFEEKKSNDVTLLDHALFG